MVRPTVLSIAGFDPSGGAGVLADCKVFECLGAQGQAVVTALTRQNEREFAEPRWRAVEQILEDLDTLGRVRRFHFVKIGLVRDAAMLAQIVRWVRGQSSEAFIVWDPILKASAGFAFHEQRSREDFVSVAGQCALVTPNAAEAEWLGAIPTSVLVKGGHAVGYESVDVLLDHEGNERARFAMPRIAGASKHGTGCMLSAAILARVALGDRLEVACDFARRFIQELLRGGSGALCAIAPIVTADNSSRLKVPRVYPITWDRAALPHTDQVRALIEGGARWIQLRMKSAEASARRRVALESLRLCRRAGVRLIINDDVSLCAEIGADGVHLGLGDMPLDRAREILGEEVIIGGTANTPEQVRERILAGADYVGVGPYRHTDTKEKLSPILGPDGVRRAVRAATELKPGYPVVVIGGVTERDLGDILALGASGVAVSSAIVASGDPAGRMRLFMQAAESVRLEESVCNH